MKPVLFVTNHVPPERVGAFAALQRRMPIELAIFGGRSTHATAGVADPGVPHRFVEQREIRALAASGAYGAVVCGTAGRVALPAAWIGARSAKTPFVLWTALWAHPRTPAHIVGGAPLLAVIYRDAAAVVAYGSHVAAFARSCGARNVHVAPQAVDNDFWGAHITPDPGAPFTAVFVGRASRAKGAAVLLTAWRSSGFGAPAALVLVGGDSGPPRIPAGGAVCIHGDPAARAGPQLSGLCRRCGDAVAAYARLPRALGARRKRGHEPVHAHHRQRRGRCRGGRARAPRAQRARRASRGRRPSSRAPCGGCTTTTGLRARLGANARRDVFPYTFDAWAAGFEAAIGSLR